MVAVLCSQRDRFRKRVSELEEENMQVGKSCVPRGRPWRVGCGDRCLDPKPYTTKRFKNGMQGGCARMCV